MTLGSLLALEPHTARLSTAAETSLSELIVLKEEREVDPRRCIRVNTN